MKHKIRGIVCIVVGLILAFSGAGLYAHYEHSASEAGQNAQKLLYDLEPEIILKQPAVDAPQEEAPKKSMVQTTLNGYDLIGIIRISEANIDLPVLASWDYDLLQISPCRYSGSVYTDDLILLAHNYEEHFGNLDLLENGDAVEFIDIEGNIHSFYMAKSEILEPTQVDELTKADYPLALFTCTPGGYSRLVIYCEYK